MAKLVGKVVADDVVLEEALAVARHLSARDPQLIAEVKRLVAAASDLPLADAMRTSLSANVASRLKHVMDT
jgi:enoyl-CoA hydratase/carnithine racemase